MSTKPQEIESEKVIGYVRVSNESQAENSSLETQTDAIKQHCAASDLNCIRIFSDIGSGADTDDRPEYRAALKFIARNKNIKAMVAVRLDRVSRNTMDILRLLDFLKARSRGLQIIEMPLDPFTPLGRLVITIMAAVAELERHLILERTASGRRAKEAKGEYAYGSPAFGWMAHAGSLLPDVVEQQIINYIAKWHKAQWSLREMAAKLTALKLPTKRGGKWHPSIVSKILKRLKK